MDPVLMDERELGVEIKKILVRGSASHYGKELAVRILLKSDVSVGELRILDVVLGLYGEETLCGGSQDRTSERTDRPGPVWRVGGSLAGRRL